MEDEEMEMMRPSNTAVRIIAIRIYYDCFRNSMAELLFNDYIVENIEWTDARKRKEFEPYINGYTLIYDERPKKEWSELTK